MLQKLGFWSVFGLVTGSQIGTAVLMLPANLAPFGIYSLIGWIVSSCGAIVLALLFAILCAKFPRTGGPHVYVKKAFGNSAAFFTGWTYWVISWVSTSTVVITAIGYLSPLIGAQNSSVYLILEILLLSVVMALNLKGIGVAGRIEILLVLLKFIPLVIIPIAALMQFNASNFVIDQKVSSLTTSQILGKVVLLTFWGFIGIEAATAQAESVINPSKTIPKAIIIGTFCVVILYLINSIGIIGLVPREDLMHSNAPYVNATQIIFGGEWHLFVSIIASVICIGTLNAWVLTSGQIALGLAQDKLLPALFGKKNKNDAPVWGVVISCVGILPLLIITANSDLSKQITEIIDFSVIAFLFVYLACSLAFLKLLLVKPKETALYEWLIACGSIVFCSWIIYETPLKVLLIASAFAASGIPVYFLVYKKQFKRFQKILDKSV
jgi:APA family basic amino acid/polyamine antiporter